MASFVLSSPCMTKNLTARHFPVAALVAAGVVIGTLPGLAYAGGQEQLYKERLDVALKGLSGRLRKPGFFGPRPIDPPTAQQRLMRGQSVLVEHPTIGTFRRESVPDKHSGFVYKDQKQVDDNYRDVALPRAKRNRQGMGIWVDSPLKLLRLAAADAMVEVPTEGVLSRGEARAAAVLRRYRGGDNGRIEVKNRHDDLRNIYGFEIHPDRSDEQPGLYDPHRAELSLMGFLTGRRARLSVLSAIERLGQNEPVVVRSRSGQEATISQLPDVDSLGELLSP